jgi:hypothetical protein
MRPSTNSGMNALTRAGCGGNVALTANGLACERCLLRIIDPLELAPRGGWVPPKDRRRVFLFEEHDEQIGNAGALA